MVEILTGALNGWKIGAEKKRDISNDSFSTTMIAFRVDSIVESDQFYSTLNRFIDDIADSQHLHTARVPFSRANSAREKHEKSGEIELENSLIKTLKSLAGT